jgi:hypothetical protein
VKKIMHMATEVRRATVKGGGKMSWKRIAKWRRYTANPTAAI